MRISVLRPYFTGLRFLTQGTKIIFKVPGLFIWALIPFLIDVFILIAGLSFGVSQISHWKGQLMSRIFDSNGWLYLLLSPFASIFLWITFMAALFYGVFVLTSLIASPFNAVIAEKVLSHYNIIKTEPFNWNRWLSTSLKMLKISLIKTVLFLTFGGILFLLSFIPIVSFIALFTTFLMIAFDFMDYSLEVKEMELSQRWRYFKTHIPQLFGMATAIGFSLLIPGLILLLLPSAVAGSAWVMSQSEDGNDPRTSS